MIDKIIFIFDIVYLLFLDDSVAQHPSHDIYKSNLIRLVRVSSHLMDLIFVANS